MKARKITAFLLAAVMLASLIPFGMISVFAEDNTAPATLPDSTAQQLKLAGWADTQTAAFSLTSALAGKAYTLSDNLLKSALSTNGDNADATATATLDAAVLAQKNVAGIMVKLKVNGTSSNNNGFQVALKVGTDTYATSSGGSANGVPVYEYDPATKTWGYYSCPASHAMRAVDNFDGYVFVPLLSLKRSTDPTNIRALMYHDNTLASKLVSSGVSAITLNQSWGKSLTVDAVQYVYVEGYSAFGTAYTLPGADLTAWSIGWPNGAINTGYEAYQTVATPLAAELQGKAYSIDAIDGVTTTLGSHAKLNKAVNHEVPTTSQPVDGALGVVVTVSLPSGDFNNGFVMGIEVNGKTYWSLTFNPNKNSYAYYQWEGSNVWYLMNNVNTAMTYAPAGTEPERASRFPTNFKGNIFIPFDQFNVVYEETGIAGYRGTKLYTAGADNEVKLTAEDIKTYGITNIITATTWAAADLVPTFSNLSYVYSAETPLLTISTADEFVAFINNIDKYDTQRVVLANDIDMTGKTWPVLEGNSNTKAFAGILDGQGYAINNINITYSNHYSAPFGVILSAGKKATFTDLTLNGTVNCGGKWQKGGLYYAVNGDLDILNVTNNLNVTNTNGDMAGFVASIRAGANVLIKDSSLNGYIQGKWSGNVGGFVGTNAGNLTIDNCVMAAEVTNTLTTADATKGGDLGGFVVNNSTGAVLVIKDSIMTGSVKHCSKDITHTDGAYVGGYVAYQSKGGYVLIENCVQMGTVQTIRTAAGTGLTGGFIGLAKTDAATTESVILKNCSYFGTTQHTLATDAAGFIASGLATDITLIDCVYAGKVIAGNDITTAVETGNAFFTTVTAANLKDCAGNKIAASDVTLSDASALLGADILTDETATDAKADYYGYQTKVVDGKLSVRLVGSVDSLDYEKIGVKYQIYADNAKGGAAIVAGTLDTTTVYTSVKGETQTYTAAEGEYFYALTLADIAVDGDVIIVVSTFHVEDGAEVIGDTCIVTVDWTPATVA